MFCRILALLTLVASAHPASTRADTGAPVRTAPNLEAWERPLEKSGTATLSVLFWDIYESELFTPGGLYRSGIRPLQLVIRYLRPIASKALVKQTEKEWQAQGRDHPLQREWLTRLEAMWPDIEEGDTLVLELDSKGAARFFYNGRELGSIKDPDFGALFTGIWLAPDTTRPALRRRLIGGAGDARE